jgi:hypothetical protein
MQAAGYMSSFLAAMRGRSVLAWYEKDHKQWGPFGGKIKEGDGGDSVKTAIREFKEEWLAATGGELDDRYAKDLASVGETVKITDSRAVVHTLEALPWMVEAEEQHESLRWIGAADGDQRYVLQRICSKLFGGGGSSPLGDKRKISDADEQPQAKQCKRNFTELISEDHARYFLSLTDKEVKDQFWDVSDDVSEDGKKRDIVEHAKMVRAYCVHALANGGKTDVTYKFSRAVQHGGHTGRLFAMIAALQAMQGKVRAFLCGGKVKDLDMINAHLVLLLQWAKDELKGAAACPRLEEYVSSRKAVLRDHRLTKRQVLIALNCDELATSKKAAGEGSGSFYTKNTWLKSFWAEKDKLVRTLHARLSAEDGYNFAVTNESNEYSSWMNKVLCRLENECLQKVVSHFGDAVHSLIFDGLHVDTSAGINIDQLNALTAPVRWAIKPMVTEIEIPSAFNPEDSLDYAMQKHKLEYHPCGMPHYAVVEHPKRQYLHVHEHYVKTKNYGIVKKWHHTLHCENDFKAAAREFRVAGPKRDVSIFNPYMDDPTKVKYDRTDFTPFPDGEEDELATVGRVYNTFRGFGATKLDSYDGDFIQPYLDLAYHLVGENQEYADYLLNWQAHIYQKPDDRTDICLVFRGAHGTGKDSWNDVNEHVMGMSNHYLHRTAKMGEVLGNFNSSLKEKVMLQFNEVGALDAAVYEDLFKDVITTDRLTINEKHLLPVYQTNYLNVMVFTNANKCPIKLEKGDRRFVAFKTSDKLKGDTEFFDKLHGLMQDQNWINHVYTFLMRRDLSNFVAKDDRPLTDEYLTSQALNIPDVFNFLHEQCDNDFEEWSDHTLPREGVPFKFLAKKNIKAAYADYRKEHFSAKEADNFCAKSLWNNFEDTSSEGAIKLNKFIAPGLTTPSDFYCIYPEKLKEYLEEHHPRKYGLIDDSRPSGDFILPGVTAAGEVIEE